MIEVIPIQRIEYCFYKWSHLLLRNQELYCRSSAGNMFYCRFELNAIFGTSMLPFTDCIPLSQIHKLFEIHLF